MPVASGRVSAVFDFARTLLIIDLVEGRELERAEVTLEEKSPANRVRRVEGFGVQNLICGAISRPMAEQFEDAGIPVTPLVSGTVDEVLAAYQSGELEQSRFLMPGSTEKQRQGLRSRVGDRTVRGQQ